MTVKHDMFIRAPDFGAKLQGQERHFIPANGTMADPIVNIWHIRMEPCLTRRSIFSGFTLCQCVKTFQKKMFL